MHRFYFPQQLDKEILMVKERAVVHHMKNVLRLKKGEYVAFFNDKPEHLGFDYAAELKNIEGASAVFMLREKIENKKEPSKKLTIYQSLIKKDKFEWVLEKTAEIGVFEIVPIISARSEKKSLNLERCRMILKEAAEQSGRAIIPKIQNVISFERALRLAELSAAKTYLAYEGEKENLIRGMGDRQANLFIGPEGGWEGREIFAAGRANFESVSLGRLTFRSETACVVASYTLLWG